MTETDILVDNLRRQCGTVIDRELARLARRAPGMTGDELDAVCGALHRIADRLMLDRLPALSRDEIHILLRP